MNYHILIIILLCNMHISINLCMNNKELIVDYWKKNNQITAILHITAQSNSEKKNYTFQYQGIKLAQLNYRKQKVTNFIDGQKISISYDEFFELLEPFDTAHSNGTNNHTYDQRGNRINNKKKTLCLFQ